MGLGSDGLYELGGILVLSSPDYNAHVPEWGSPCWEHG